MNDTHQDLSGQIVAGCELIRQLGMGNNGVVYLANQKKLNRLVACKIISPDLQEDPDFLDTLYSEAANAAKLSHPHVIQALDAGDDNGLKYFLMEYVEGDSLEHIRANSPELLSTQFLLKLSLQLVDTMDHIWKNHKMIHGDIKPGNLLITRNSHSLKIGDLGLAHSANGAADDPDDVMITPLYAAPEIIARQAHSPDPRSDIYSFGIMLYELACGKAPFTGTVEELLNCHLHQYPVSAISMNPDLDRDFALLIDSMIAKDPQNRPASWQALKTALLEIYNRLYPAVRPADVAAKAVSLANSQNPAPRAQSSWSVEQQKKKSFMEKFPWVIPALLIILIAGALVSIVINLGLFE